MQVTSFTNTYMPSPSKLTYQPPSQPTPKQINLCNTIVELENIK